MNRVSLLICVLFVLKSRLADAKLQKKLIQPKQWKTCKSMIEDPVCVKMKFMRKDINRTAYIYLINKCEMEYMKYHKDAEAMVVSNKFCEHITKSNSSKVLASRVQRQHSSKMKSFHKRPKRAIQKKVKSLSKFTMPGKKRFIQQKKLALRSDLEDTDNEDSGSLHFSNEQPIPESDHSTSEEQGEGKDYEKPASEEKIAMDCPTECEIRGVMVCAKCAHGVYRTFLSPCHMRMFVCNNLDESLELMSRYPCALSVPYDQPVEGHLEEPNDNDAVLRFIYCREQRELRSEKILDPRCAGFDDK